MEVPKVQLRSHQDAGLCLQATEEHRAQLGPRVQLLLHRGHHAEASLGPWLQTLSSQLGHCGAQALWVLLSQRNWHIQELGHLGWGEEQRSEPKEGAGGPTPRSEGGGAGALDWWVCGRRGCTLSMRAATETIWGKNETWRNFSCMSHRKRMDDRSCL